MTETSTPPDMSVEEAMTVMGDRLAGLTAAVDGFAARQQELLGRDYSEDLAKIHERWSKAREAFVRLGERPALALTPEQIANQIQAAGKNGRAADHQAWQSAERQLQGAIRSIDEVTLSARTAEKQDRWLGIAAGVAGILGFIGGCTIPPVVDHAMPESWHWPEQRAAKILDRSGWDAGVRLMQVYDPEQWQTWANAARLSDQNGDVLAECTRRAAKKRTAIACSIKMRSIKAR